MARRERSDGARRYPVTTWPNTPDGNVSNSLNGLSLMGVLNTRAGGSIQGLQNLKSPRSLSLPEYGPGQHSGAIEDCHSLKSVDSGIPTLEVGNPEPVHCNVLIAKRKQSEPEIVPDRTFQSACTLPSCVPPRPLASEHDHAVRKSSTFPRTGYDTVKLYSPTSKTLNRSDDISVCSVSSLSTELSTTLSVSNEDILDFMVTSSSSAIVTLETDETHFSDVTLSSTKESGDQSQQGCCQEADVDTKRKILGPFTNFLARNLFTRRQNARLEKQNDVGWKLFGKVPLRENSHKDPKKIQKVFALTLY
ncbi:TBC1 domain family member 14-like isoform X2 [Meleagris gallopavo]|uniref:TBC1 domain family member 14-like isoform X2 n=1 Tax=Meleagris gallopavo TaxID=9103 RepID=UPI000549C67A|nr:TBC1 domain family member 14-like isoform X2 [Meleagris gallopavo]